MTKFYIFFVLIFFVVVTSNAQRFEGGVLGGITASQVDGDSYSGFNKLGLHFGVFTKTQLNPHWGAQFELKYSGRGAFEGSFMPDQPRIYQLSLHYISLPLVAQFYFTDDIYFESGIAYGYLLGRRMYDNGGRVPDEQIKLVGDFKKSDLDGIIGVNYSLQENITIGIRYAYSIIPIRKRNTGYYYYGFIARMIGYTKGDYNNFLTVGVYYNLSK